MVERHDENIKVLVRIRPPLARESHDEIVTRVRDEGKVLAIETDSHNVQARFDHVFGIDSSQEDVYEEVKFAAESVVSGLSSTIFAYGQTGSGKSYTMFGPEDDLSIYGTAPSDTMGVIPRAVRAILENVDRRRRENSDEEEISIYCSFMQIYNDQPFDLLRDPMRLKPLQVHENTNTKDIFVVGLSEYGVTSLHDCLALLEQGDEQRACRATQMNDVSSRSHSIFQIVVERRNLDNGKLVRSKMNLVDLAGSEKWGLMDTLETGHVSELVNINTSLHVLARVISALTDEETSYVPYRDSKLTRILQDSLGGNARCCVIATLSPSSNYIEETISTLKFADRAKRVMQHARVVETREVSLELVERLEREIVHLRKLLADAGISANYVDDPSAPQVDEEQTDTNAVMKLERKLFEANEKIRKLENASSIGNSGNSSNNNNNTSAGPASVELQQENKKLKNLLANVFEASQRFFNFEIEEEEFQDQVERYFSNAPALTTKQNSKTGPSAAHRKLIIPAVRESGFRAKSHTPTNGGISPAPRTKAAYRVRGKGEPGQMEWGACEFHEDTESRAKAITSSLKEKQKELAKHRKLQQWVAEKAQKELERLELERKQMEDREMMKKCRNDQFKKHATLVKRKLHKMKQEDLRTEEGGMMFPKIGKPSSSNNNNNNIIVAARPESRSSILNGDTRPLSRQTIFEEAETSQFN